MDTAQWPQGVGVVKPMESSRPVLERSTRPQKDQALNCPRCNSTNTKFCYYNNYSLSQPRYFCKTCRRYWTEGGSLRSVPVGGGSRKNKRSSTSSSSNSGSSNKKLIPDHHHLISVSGLAQSALQQPKIARSQDLNLTFPPPDNQDYSTVPKFVEVPYSSTDEKRQQVLQNPNSSSVNPQLSAVELLKSTDIASSRVFGSFMGMPVSDSSAMYSGGYSLQDFKPSLSFSSEEFENGYGSLPGIQDSTGARLLFPVEELKQVPTTTEFDRQNRSQADQSTSGYWNGMLGGGSW